MSKSVERVRTCLAASGVSANIHAKVNPTRTAEEAAAEVGCLLNQIVKSMVFAGCKTGTLYLFLVAGGNRISAQLVEELIGEPMERADPNRVRKETGFSIGGVAPIAHRCEIHKFLDKDLLQFAEVWAAAGSPNHVFDINPNDLVAISGAEPADFVE